MRNIVVMRPYFMLALCLWFCVAESCVANERGDDGVFQDIKLSEVSFNPSRDESISLSYNLQESGKVTVDIYDADHGLIKQLRKQFLEQPSRTLILKYFLIQMMRVLYTKVLQDQTAWAISYSISVKD